MDKSYLFGRNTSLGELPPNIIINIKAAVIFRSGEVAEHKLRCFRVGVFLQDTIDIIHAGIDLAVGVIGQHRVNHSLVECKFSPVIRDFEHIVDVRLNSSGTDFLGSLGKVGDHFCLYLARLGLDIVVIDLWNGELQHIGGLNVRNLSEHLHKLWQVIKFCKSRLSTVVRTLWSKLQSRDRFSKSRSPTVKMLQAVLHQRVVLQVPLNRIQLHH